MSSKAIPPHGKVTKGKYEGLNVYVWKENVSLKIVEGIVDRAIFAKPFSEVKTIDATTVESYEVISTSSETALTDVALGAAVVFGGKNFARSLANSNQKPIYIVAIHFKDDTKCLVEIDEFAYKTLTTACFSF